MMRFILIVVAVVCMSAQCSSNKSVVNGPTVDHFDKQRGIHLFRTRDSINFQPFISNNINWITFVSWAYQEQYDSPQLRNSGDSIQIQEANQYWKERIESAHKNGMKVFLKPHLWMHSKSDEKWRSDIYPTNEENWELWKASYSAFIMRYARLAESAEVELFCIGTEFTRLTLEKSEFWENIIQEIRTVYSGKLTYAANWYKEYDQISFWGQLDYIGIQAYFPLVETSYPTVNALTEGWKTHIKGIEKIALQYNRPILFTEMGYKSTASSAIKPWEWAENESDLDNTHSPETQSNCYEAFFQAVWNKPWFAGVHIWQFRADHKIDHTQKNIDFTPQGKPAEKIIQKGFSYN